MVSSSVMAERKEKRMLSNRESARRSRMRKQKHLDDLMLQMMELSNRLQCLGEIIHCMNIAGGGGGDGGGVGAGFATGSPTAEDDCLLRPWSSLLIKHGLLGSDMYQYC